MADPMLPPTVVDLAWQGGMRFAARSGTAQFTLDGPDNADPTPVQALAGSVAACMGIDLVQILTKGRHPLAGLRIRLTGDRRGVAPKHFTRIALHFALEGDVPPEAVERAIQLSREKYCSVWLSLRQDIELVTGYEITKERRHPTSSAAPRPSDSANAEVRGKP